MPEHRRIAKPQSRRHEESQFLPPTFQALEARLLLDAKWTVMVYIDGDNNLEAAAITDFLEMASVGSNADVKVVAELDRSPYSQNEYDGYDDSYGDWSNTRRGIVQPGDEPGKAWGQSIGEADMSDPGTLASFVNWAEANYPAQNYALVLWDHGGGYTGACWDETTDWNAHMTPAALSSAMTGFTQPVQLIGFDACLMSMMEVGYQVWDQAQVFVGSQETEDSAGWSYSEVLGDLTANSDWTPAQLAVDIVADFAWDYNKPGAIDTLSAIDLAKLGGPGGAVDALTDFVGEAMNASSGDATEMGDLWWGTSFFGASDRTDSDYTDLGTFLEAIASDPNISSQSIRSAAQTALDAYYACILSNFSAENAASTGLSVFLPARAAAIASDYNSVDAPLAFASDTGWGQFLHWWYDNSKPAPKISLTGAGHAITAPNVPSWQTDTDFRTELLGEDVIPASFTHEFTITNLGTTTLHLTGIPAIQLGGPAAGDFTVTTPPPDKIGAGESGTFKITFDPTAVGVRNATVLIYTDDPNNRAFQFNIRGIGDAPILSVDRDPIIVMEGNSGTTDAVFTVTISRDPVALTDVTYSTVAGTAESGVDYTAVTGTLTFVHGGPRTQTVAVPIVGDATPELDETFYLDLSGATKAGISTTQGQGVGIIRNDDGTEKTFGGAVKAVTFTDPQDGDIVTVSLTGPGQGTVLLDGPNGPCLGIGVLESNPTSVLTVAVRKGPQGNGQVTIGDIVIDGSMKSITAGAINLTGDFRVTGQLSTLVLGNVTGGGTMDIDADMVPLTTGTVLTVTLGRVSDTSLNTHAVPIKSLTAIEWTNTPASPGELITAPSLGALTIKGSGKTGPAGDFQAGLVLDDSDTAKLTLGTVKIAGAVTGTEWDVTGPIGAITVTGAMSDWTLQGPDGGVTDLKSLTMGLVGANVIVHVNGNIGALKATEWVGGVLTAKTITSITTVGIAKGVVAGNFGPSVRITGPVAKGLVLGSVKIAGAIADSGWDIDGNVGPITVGGATSNWTLQGTGGGGAGLVGVKGLTVGEATNCQVRVQDALGALKATRWTGGYIQADRLDALSVVGTKTGVSGDFTPTELKLLGANTPSKAALGSANVAGNVQNSLWYVHGKAGAITIAGWVRNSDVCATGAIASLTLGATDSSDFFAGLDFSKVDPEGTDPAKLNMTTCRRVSAVAQFTDPTAKIGSVTVRGVAVPVGQAPPPFVLNSNFSSPYFGAVKLTNLGAGPSYGIYVANKLLLHVASVAIADTLNHSNWSWTPSSGKPFAPTAGSLELKFVS